MIEIANIIKFYPSDAGDILAVNNVSLTIREGAFFGMVGTNGAGKSTLLRMMAGSLRPDSGSVTIDGKTVYDNPIAKSKLFFIPDEPFYFHNSTPMDMARYYKALYSDFDVDRFAFLMKDFNLDFIRKINSFSKGMKKQLSILLGIASGCKYLMMDETFDGLDPVMRTAVKSLFAKEMIDRGLTPILTSHNLRELEDICEHVGLLHQGGVIFSKDIEDMKLNIRKLQVVFASDEAKKTFEDHVDILTSEHRGKLYIYTIRGSHDVVMSSLDGIDTTFHEILNLTLEEIFISETEVNGYDIKKFIME